MMSGLIMVVFYGAAVSLCACILFLVAREFFFQIRHLFQLDRTEIAILSGLSAYVFFKGVSYALWERRRQMERK